MAPIPPEIPRRIRSPRAIILPALLFFVLSAPAPLVFAGDLTVTARQRNSRPLVGAVITLESETINGAPAPPVAAVMDQVDLAFAPDVLVIPVNSTVQFPNSDVVSHQVYSFSGAKTFQLPLYRGKPYPPVVFDRPGVVTLGCNIHDNMVAYILVTRATYFGRTNGDGRWTADAVSPGRYVLRLWHPLLNEKGEVTRAVTVESASAGIEVALTRNLRPAPIKGRPHSWDY